MTKEKEIKIDVPTVGQEIQSLDDISLNDLQKWQLFQVLKIANYNPEKMPLAVSVLEAMLKEDLDENYYKAVEEIEKKANKMFPMWQRDSEQRMERAVQIAYEKFTLLWEIIKRKSPSDFETFL